MRFPREECVPIRSVSEPGSPPSFRAFFNCALAIASSEDNLAQGKIDHEQENRFVFRPEDELLASTDAWLEAVKEQGSLSAQESERQLAEARNRRRQQLEKDREWFSYERRLNHLVSKVEKLAEFSDLERELLEIGLGIGTTWSNGQYDVSRIVPLAALFDCLGVYHDILADESCKSVWARVETALQHKQIKAKVLLELRGCDFPDEFRLLGWRVVKMSAEKWLTLCSRGDVLSAKHGCSIEVQADGRWYLETIESDDATLVSHLRAREPAADLHGSGRRNKGIEVTPDRATGSSTSRAFALAGRGSILDYMSAELLVLALCHSGNLNTGEVLYSIPGGGVILLSDRYRPKTFEGDPYAISKSDWREFQEFLKLISINIIRSHSIQTLWEVARRYLRGRLMECAVTPHEWSDEYDDVVLNYVTALEKLVMLPDEKNSISHRAMQRVAYLVARKAEERRNVVAFIRNAYELRNAILHRKTNEEPEVDLPKLRDICRRAIACALILAGNAGEKNYQDDFLRRLEFSPKAQEEAKNTAKQIGSLTSCIWVANESAT
jgi:hypothetical protein